MGEKLEKQWVVSRIDASLVGVSDIATTRPKPYKLFRNRDKALAFRRDQRKAQKTRKRKFRYFVDPVTFGPDT